MVLVALVSLAGFVAAEPIPAASCPDGLYEYCCTYQMMCRVKNTLLITTY